MSRYYVGRQARLYNTRLCAFSDRTLSEALAMVDFDTLRYAGKLQGRAPRILMWPAAQAYSSNVSLNELRKSWRMVSTGARICSSRLAPH